MRWPLVTLLPVMPVVALAQSSQPPTILPSSASAISSNTPLNWDSFSDSAGNNFQVTVIDPPSGDPLELLLMNGTPLFFQLPDSGEQRAANVRSTGASSPEPPSLPGFSQTTSNTSKSTSQGTPQTTLGAAMASGGDPSISASQPTPQTSLGSALAFGSSPGGNTATGPSDKLSAEQSTPSSAIVDGSCGGATTTSGYAQGFTVAPTGFTSPNGQPWNMRGLDGANVTEALAAFPNVVDQNPGMTAIRLAVVPGKDTQDQVNQAVLDYNSRGIVVELEDHSGNGNNVAWYQQQAQTFKDNPLVFLETPNEPKGNVASDQISIIQAIRSAGFNNPIGIQWDFNNGETSDNLAQVTAAVGTTNLFAAPHIYGSPWQMSAAQADQSAGLYTVADEFGDAENGFTIDQQGQQVVDSVIQSNQSGAIGAIFWAMGNGYHSDGADSVCADASCRSLTSMGSYLRQSWLGSTGGQIAQSSLQCTQLKSSQLATTTAQTFNAEGQADLRLEYTSSPPRPTDNEISGDMQPQTSLTAAMSFTTEDAH